MLKFLNHKTLFLFCLTISSLSYASVNNQTTLKTNKTKIIKPTAMAQNYSQLKKDYQIILQNIIAKIDILNSQMKKFNSIQDNLIIDENSGYVKKLEVRAQRYSAELKARKQYTKHIAEITQLTKNLKNIQFKLSFFEEYYKNLPTPVKTKNAEVKKADEKQTQYNKQKIDITKGSLFEVLTPAPLKSISALPEVYNDATLWEKIYLANKKYIKDPKGIIPAGTLLLIPHIDKIKNFKNIK